MTPQAVIYLALALSILGLVITGLALALMLGVAQRRVRALETQIEYLRKRPSHRCATPEQHATRLDLETPREGRRS